MNIPAELIWFLAGLVLILLEFAAPGIVIVFFGAGAWLTALTTWFGLTNGLTSQLLLWAISSVLMLIVLRKRLADKFHGFETGQQNPMSNLDEFTGREVLVTQSIDPGHREGRVEFKGADWTAVSTEPIAAGRLAIITAAEGLTLTVNPVQSGDDIQDDDDANEGE